MKIAQLCLSPALGGLELYVARYYQWLRDQGHDALIIARPGSRLAERVGDVQPLRVRNKHLPLPAALRLARLTEAEGIDVLHVHWKYDLPLAAWAKRLARRPLKLAHSRHMVMPHAKHDPYHRFLYRHLDAFIAVTGQIQKQAQAQLPLPPERIFQLYPGAVAPTACDCEPFWRETGIERRKLMVGLIGRIKHFKGQHVLVEAVAQLAARGLDVGAVIIGHAMEEAYLRDLQQRVARQGLQDRIHFPGFHPQPAAIMGCFDVVALTTLEETFGLVLIEAMRAGTAVVGTNAGGVPEIIEDGADGLLVPPDDADSLAAALQRLYHDSALRERLAATGKARADRQFAEETQFAELTQLLHRLAAPAAGDATITDRAMS